MTSLIGCVAGADFSSGTGHNHSERRRVSFCDSLARHWRYIRGSYTIDDYSYDMVTGATNYQEAAASCWESKIAKNKNNPNAVKDLLREYLATFRTVVAKNKLASLEPHEIETLRRVFYSALGAPRWDQIAEFKRKNFAKDESMPSLEEIQNYKEEQNEQYDLDLTEITEYLTENAPSATNDPIKKLRILGKINELLQKTLQHAGKETSNDIVTPALILALVRATKKLDNKMVLECWEVDFMMDVSVDYTGRIPGAVNCMLVQFDAAIRGIKLGMQ